MEHLTPAEVVLLHVRLIQGTSGSAGVRDMDLLESALARPQATFDHNDLYPDLCSEAAVLMDSLIKNHLCWLLNSSTRLPASELPTSPKQALCWSIRIPAWSRPQHDR